MWRRIRSGCLTFTEIRLRSFWLVYMGRVLVGAMIFFLEEGVLRDAILLMVGSMRVTSME